VQHSADTQPGWPPVKLPNPTDAKIDSLSDVPGPDDCSYYSEEFLKTLESEASRLGAVRIYDLCFLLAEFTDLTEAIEELWNKYKLNDVQKIPVQLVDEDDRKRLAEYLESKRINRNNLIKMTRDLKRVTEWRPRIPPIESFDLTDRRGRAGAWYWLLLRWTTYPRFKPKMGPAVKSYFFADLSDRYPIKLLGTYDYQMGRPKRVKEDQEQCPTHYVKLAEFVDYVRQLSVSSELSSAIEKMFFLVNQTRDSAGRSKNSRFEGAKRPLCKIEPTGRMVFKDQDNPRMTTEQLAQIGLKFIEGRKHERVDNLNKAIINAWEKFIKETAMKPTARNVYDWLEVKGNILEKEEGDNGDPIAIHWKRSKDKEERTSYHTFESRLSRLRKKGILPLPKISK